MFRSVYKKRTKILIQHGNFNGVLGIYIPNVVFKENFKLQKKKKKIKNGAIIILSKILFYLITFL
ncbi:hypothetical protein GIB67_018714 [Kingdonia uniflora]|uniref:Uncharacterized protein n=1 Tax=Kingdonia uniflora TaxID=39325 RepID=A0A7J7L254_9MAGN|nr:hypothetical protein GIB67_018714 [Kingdonia uniflora]